MSKAHKYLFWIAGGQGVLLLFFGAFAFEKILAFMCGGVWLGIAIARWVLKRAPGHWYTEVLLGIFGVQAVVFIGLEFARAKPELVESAAFFAIGVWIGVLIGLLLNALDELEKRLVDLGKDEQA